jgi:hypothetical protein
MVCRVNAETKISYISIIKHLNPHLIQSSSIKKSIHVIILVIFASRNFALVHIRSSHDIPPNVLKPGNRIPNVISDYCRLKKTSISFQKAFLRVFLMTFNLRD